MKLIFASNNQHKIAEIRSAIPENISITSLKESGIEIEIPEPHDSLSENAAEKARTIERITGTDCFSEDTGLEVYALNNQPGVHSARYAGEERSPEKNMEKLLKELKTHPNREARFRTVICLKLNKKEYFFEGVCEGMILEEARGEKGFGYDPVFMPKGSLKTFAEMATEEKNKFSHRKKAMDKLVAFLNNYQ